MKIVRLQSENVKRITAVDIAPDGNLIVIGGKNGMGKSSVLDSIAYALGGQALVPTEPIRQGETEAKVVVHLEELTITRKFKRDPHWSCGAHSPDDPMHADCVLSFGPTTSTLVVTNKDGAKYPSPQNVLDRLLSGLTFDPLAFAHSVAKDQASVLRSLVGIDESELNKQRALAFALRTDLNKQFKQQEVLVKSAAFFKDAPSEGVSTAAISKMMTDAEQRRQLASDAAMELRAVKEQYATTKQRYDTVLDTIAKLTKQLNDAKNLAGELDSELCIIAAKVSDATLAEGTARSAVPDTLDLQTKLADIEKVNQQVQANEKRNALVARLSELERAVKEKTDEITSIDAAKEQMLTAARFPVQGLGLSESGVTFNGLPLEQASSSEQLHISVAIGLALNPSLKVLLVRNGNTLDHESLATVGKMATEAEAQVWMEYVSEDGQGVSVMIEDGHVK